MLHERGVVMFPSHLGGRWLSKQCFVWRIRAEACCGTLIQVGFRGPPFPNTPPLSPVTSSPRPPTPTSNPGSDAVANHALAGSRPRLLREEEQCFVTENKRRLWDMIFRLSACSPRHRHSSRVSWEGPGVRVSRSTGWSDTGYESSPRGLLPRSSSVA